MESLDFGLHQGQWRRGIATVLSAEKLQVHHCSPSLLSPSNVSLIQKESRKYLNLPSMDSESFVVVAVHKSVSGSREWLEP